MIDRKLQKIRSSGFGEWSRTKDIDYMVSYLFKCLAGGDGDNVAWELYEGLGLTDITAESLVTIVNFLHYGEKSDEYDYKRVD